MTEVKKNVLYYGSTVNHPNQQLVGTWHGKIEDQEEDTINGFSMIRLGTIPSLTTLPDTLCLKFDDEHRVYGQMAIESLSITNPDKTIRFFIPEWNVDSLRFYFVEIKENGDMTVNVRQNPSNPHFISQRTDK